MKRIEEWFPETGRVGEWEERMDSGYWDAT